MRSTVAQFSQSIMSAFSWLIKASMRSEHLITFIPFLFLFSQYPYFGTFPCLHDIDYIPEINNGNLNISGWELTVEIYDKCQNITKLPFKKSGIYEINCKLCDKVHVGQTKRNLETRKKEHFRNLRLNHIEKSSLFVT